MSDIETLEEQVTRQEAVEAIRKLKYKYWRSSPNFSWDEVRECFADDATTSYGHSNGPHKLYWCEGADAILKFLQDSLPAFIKSGHVGAPFAYHDEIDVLSDTTARGLWTLGGILFDTNEKRVSLGGGSYYHDEYIKMRGEWKIKHTGSGLCAICGDEWLKFYTKRLPPSPLPTPGIVVSKGPGMARPTVS